MKSLIIIILICVSPASFAIELIINGKSYHIESYQIENNGQRIVIPHKVEPKRAPSSSFESLLQDLEGGYRKLEKSLEKSNSGPRNFR